MEKPTKIILWIIIAVIVVVGVWFGLSKNPTDETKEPIKIGAILPLTGDLGFVGEGMRNALEMAKNSALAEYGKNVEFVVQDDKSCDPVENVTIMRQFVDVYNLKGVVGSVCSHSMLAITSIANDNKMVLISPSATAPEIRDEGEYIFRTSLADDLRANVLAKYVYDKVGKSIALLYENVDASIAFNKVFEERFKGLGGEIIAEEINERGATDLRTQILKLKESGAERILFTEFPQETIIFLKQAKELGLKATLVQAFEGVMESPELEGAVGELINNIIYLNPKKAENPEAIRFVEVYQEMFGEEPPIYAAEAYDAAILLIKCYNDDPEVYRQCVSETKSFQGVSGTITFDKNGDTVKPLEIKVIRDLMPETLEIIE